MRDSNLQLLLLVAVVAIIFLIVKYYRLQSQLNQRVQQQFDAWRTRELEAARSQLRQVAQAEAGVALACFIHEGAHPGSQRAPHGS